MQQNDTKPMLLGELAPCFLPKTYNDLGMAINFLQLKL